MTSFRTLAIPDLVADPALLKRLIHESETLFVERKRRDPKDGLGPTVASFANMLGGWLLIGVDDDGQAVGYSPPGRSDLQDYIREILTQQVDPVPPFAAISVPIGDVSIGVVRVAESSDTPHITADGGIYVRNPGGKQRLTDHRDIVALARRGELARAEASRRQYGLPLIEQAMRSLERVPSDDGVPAPPPFGPEIIEWIVRATPYTVSGSFADRALSSTAVDIARKTVTSLFPGSHEPPHEVATMVEARARGLICVGDRRSGDLYADVAIDAGGVVAVRQAWRSRDGVMILPRLIEETLTPLIRAVADVLLALDGFGRAAVGLEARKVVGVTAQWDASTAPAKIHGDVLRDSGGLPIGGDLAVPAADQDVLALAERWARELGRAARLPLWEPMTST